MNLNELCNVIGLPHEVQERVECTAEKLNLEDMQETLDALTDISTAPGAYEKLKEILGEDEDNIKMLACQLICAVRDYEKYEAAGMSREIYVDTMKCFSRFIGECMEKTGRYAFDRGWWTYRQLSMVLFRVGELEYELVQHEGENAVSVHIPSDGDMNPEKVDKSLEQGRIFVGKYFPQYRDGSYICESWLLSPRLTQFLRETSNIRKFQERFRVVEDLPKDTGYIEWLFGRTEDTPYEELPEKTSLQRNVKEMLLKGEHIGAGLGIMI